jgi:hypothetical protein
MLADTSEYLHRSYKSPGRRFENGRDTFLGGNLATDFGLQIAYNCFLERCAGRFSGFVIEISG